MNNTRNLIYTVILQTSLLIPASSMADTDNPADRASVFTTSAFLIAQSDMPTENATIKMDHMQHQTPATTGTKATMTASSVNGLLKASIKSSLDPIVINQLHSWTLHLETADGNPLDNAEISVDGTMPAHSHGMPTVPRVTKSLGNGDYLVEGMQFQMPGAWRIEFKVKSAGLEDNIVLDLNL